jgi:hypothetical protein
MLSQPSLVLILNHSQRLHVQLCHPLVFTHVWSLVHALDMIGHDCPKFIVNFLA